MSPIHRHRDSNLRILDSLFKGSGVKESSRGNKLLRVLGGQREPIPPIWLMRQAGRYLPEYRAVREDVAVAGFCGGPWTVASYMVAGRGTPDQAPARSLAYNDPTRFAQLIERLVGASVEYLVRQLEAGVDAVQIFDTWAGVLPPVEFDRWCVGPVGRIVAGVRASVPNAKIIGYPRGAGTALPRYLAGVPVDAVGLDWMIDPGFARQTVPPG